MGEAKRRKTGGGEGLRRLNPPRDPPPIGKLIIPAGQGLPQRDFLMQAAALAEGVRVRLRDGLAAASRHGSSAAMLDAIEAGLDDSLARYEADIAAGLAASAPWRAEMAAVQCRRGCAFCCHLDAVVVTPLEAVRLAGAMRAGRIPDRREAVRAAMAAPAADGPSDERPHHRPCGLLVDGACSAYERRPFACRSAYSRDVGRCEDGYNGLPAVVPNLAWPWFLSIGYVTGQVAALADLGLGSALVELKPALAILLAEDGAYGRWHNGEAVFPARPGAAPP